MRSDTQHLKTSMLFLAVLAVCALFFSSSHAVEPLDPETIPKYVDPLVIPPEMPYADILKQMGGPNITYYEIEVVQFQQNILPIGADPNNPLYPKTTVWSYAAAGHPETRNYPAFTIEARINHPVRVKWINNLVDDQGHYLPHLLPVDQTLHWANPVGECLDPSKTKDCKGTSQDFYSGPVPIVTHLHGAHVGPESDGYPEAWWLPNASNIPAGYHTTGSLFDQYDPSNTDPGSAVFQYPMDQRATTLWFHDHSLGITRLNVYAGPAGFWLLRGGEEDNFDFPGPAPKKGDNPHKKYYEIPVVIQDRSFNDDGSLFYPDNRAFFEELEPDQLKIDFSPDSDVAPIWNPEAFFNTMVTNGRTWPYLKVEPRKYRLRLLNGCNSRFLVLKMVTDPLAERPATPELAFYQIGSDGGLLPETAMLYQLLMAPAERADVIVDFSSFDVGDEIYLINEGPDAPFGGLPVDPEELADPSTTGQVMKFQVVPLDEPDTSELPMTLSPITPLFPTNTRQVSLNEEESQYVCVREKKGSLVQINIPPNKPFAETCAERRGEVFGPTAALLGTLDAFGAGNPLLWADEITENPALNSTETWEIYNFTEDAHPIHLHLVMFQIVDRQPFDGDPYDPEPGETGWKDTVIAYPGEITRIKARFDIEGLYVWHCHILEHEDNEMMRPYYVGNME